MRGRREERIEKWIDQAAATALAAAVGFCSFMLLADRYRAAAAGAAVLAVYLLSGKLLGLVPAEAPTLPLRTFSPAPLSFEDFDELLLTEEGELLLTEQAELVLTDADRLKPARSASDELILDDILAKLGPQSRVVRLFDPPAMPTPGQLSARIEWHLQGGCPAEPQDASEALYQALSDLRRSLR
jgi:hypothetical protein